MCFGCLQALINTALPTFGGTASGRLQQYTPAHSNHHQQQRSSQAAAAGRAAAAAAATADPGLTAGLGVAQAAGYSPAEHMDGLSQQAGLAGIQAHFGNTGFATTPLALSGLYRSGSPALAAAIGAQLQASMGQPSVLGPGQQMTLFSYSDPATATTVDAFGLNSTAGGLTWPYGSVGLPALGAAGQQYALGGAAVPLLQQQQYSHYIGMPQQLYLQQPGLVAVASSAQLQQAVLQQQQQQLGMGRVPSAFFTQQQQGDAAQLQQQQWLGFLQQPASSQVSEQQAQGSVQ